MMPAVSDKNPFSRSGRKRVKTLYDADAEFNSHVSLFLYDTCYVYHNVHIEYVIDV